MALTLTQIPNPPNELSDNTLEKSDAFRTLYPGPREKALGGTLALCKVRGQHGPPSLQSLCHTPAGTATRAPNYGCRVAQEFLQAGKRKRALAA